MRARLGEGSKLELESKLLEELELTDDADELDDELVLLELEELELSTLLLELLEELELLEDDIEVLRSLGLLELLDVLEELELYWLLEELLELDELLVELELESKELLEELELYCPLEELELELNISLELDEELYLSTAGVGIVAQETVALVTGKPVITLTVPSPLHVYRTIPVYI